MGSKAFRLVDRLRSTPSAASKPSDDAAPAAQTPPQESKTTCVPLKKSNEKRSPTAPEIDKPEMVESEKNTPRITDVSPLDGGEWVSVTVKIGKNAEHIRLTADQYGALRPQVGAVPYNALDALYEAGRLCDAVRKGVELLGYGAMSRRRLIQKLEQRGYDRAVASSAVDRLMAQGCLPEAEDACRFAEQGVRKLWGPRRIREDLYARGFPSEAIEDAMSSLEDVDFIENCRRVIQKKYGDTPLDVKDRIAIQKRIAALMRLGYTADQIREAMRS